MLSVLILTKNESADLPACLRSIAFSDDIHVLDSHSTDQTVPLAQAAGAIVHLHAFTGYAAQRNHGLELPFKHPWLLILDADEIVPPALAAELQDIAQTAPQTISAYRLRRRDYLFNTWLKHAQISPFYIRLVRPGHARYTREINEVLEVTGLVADLKHPLDHYPFSKGIAHWVAKHNLYSTMEAALIHSQNSGTQQGLTHPRLRIALGFGHPRPDFHTRRLHQKALFYKLPARPLLKWLYMVVLRGAILDGPAGLTYATLQSIYEYLITLKTKELRLSSKKERKTPGSEASQ